MVGVADISAIKDHFTLPARLIETFNKAVVLGARLSGSILLEIEDQPTKLYYHHYRSVNTLLDQAALRLANLIEDKGGAALAVPASQVLDWERQTAHLSHKKIGVLAGLGWIGRNNLLVNRKYGSQFRLVTILTDLPLACNKPAKDGCGGCRLCLTVCPAGAIKENPADFDHLKCFEALQGFKNKRMIDQYICGICVNACKPPR